MKKEEKNIVFILGVALLFLTGNSWWWNNSVLDIILLFLIVGTLGVVWRNIFSLIFRMKRKTFVSYLFGLLSTILLLGFISSVFVVWYTLMSIYVWFVYVISSCISLLIYLLSKKTSKKKVKQHHSFQIPEISKKAPVFFRGYAVPLMVYTILWSICLYFLIISKSTEVLFSPWQTISEYFFPFFFFATILLSFFILSKYKIKTLLFVLIAHSFLLHSYLPLSHVQPWGGDVWRHLAVEQQMADGDFEPPVLFGDSAQWREVAGADLPEALVIPQKYFYGQLWGTTLFFHYTSHIDLKTLNIWLVPFLWSLFLPLIFFYIGKTLFGSWRKGLWLSFFSLTPFSFQAVGSLSLPVSLGYLTFFFTLMLWFRYLKSGRILQRRIALLFAILMLFGYTLHFILIWLVIGISFVVRHVLLKKKKSVSIAGLGALGILSALFLPVLEFVGRTSNFPSYWNLAEQGKQMVGQFSGWYFASSIRPHDILSGNIFFNHTPDYAFSSGLFSNWRWHMLIGMILFIGLAKLGFWRILRKKSLELQVFVFLSISTIFGYLIGWFILVGDRSFIRRLDVMLAFVIIVLVLFSFEFIVKFKKNSQLFIAICLLLFISWFGMTAYASGPDMRVVSQDEYDVAQYVWDGIDMAQEKQCVLADTWILLPLEALSSQKIVGGGFPIDSQFGQKELVVLSNGIQESPSEEILRNIHSTSESGVCAIIATSKNMQTADRDILSTLTSSTPKQIGNHFIWISELKEGL
ncbi:MAG: hypothetical protein ABII02_00815 [Candidatus Magasanikbacteria bacterium]